MDWDIFDPYNARYEMNGREFIKKLRKLGRQREIEVTVLTKRGKGSHKILYYGENWTTVKQGEIGEGLLNAMLKQLGLTKDDIGE